MHGEPHRITSRRLPAADLEGEPDKHIDEQLVLAEARRRPNRQANRTDRADRTARAARADPWPERVTHRPTPGAPTEVQLSRFNAQVEIRCSRRGSGRGARLARLTRLEVGFRARGMVYDLRMSSSADRMSHERFYPIGTPGQPWGDAEKAQWYESCSIQRSYRDEVLSQLESLDKSLEVEQYGALSIDPDRYPLFAVRTARTLTGAPWALITGGVHGYETSGVQGALAFLAGHALTYAERLNLLIAPCVSPWGYEVINRWNARAVDPNRSFVVDSPSEESAALMKLLESLGAQFLVHVDLHETTDSDKDEFRPALAARDGKPFEPGVIPDGFYTVGDSANPQTAFQAAIVAGVEQVTHIAPPDANGEIIEAKVTQHGVINYPCRELGLCAGVTDAPFTSTTEVYPDSSRVTAEVCNAAQVAAVRAALDHALAHALRE